MDITPNTSYLTAVRSQKLPWHILLGELIDNAFDAAGLTRLTDEIEERRKRRNEIEQDAEVAIRQKDLEAERVKLEIARDTEYARLAQEREVEVRRASQTAEIAAEQAEKQRAAKEAEITAGQQVDLAQLAAER